VGHRLRFVTRSADRLQAPDTLGWKVIGLQMGVTIGGLLVVGTVRLMKEPIGTIPTMTTTGRVGRCTKATGTMKITTATTDVTVTTTITKYEISKCRDLGIIGLTVVTAC